MKSGKKSKLNQLLLTTILVATAPALAGDTDYERGRWHPIHFKPAIDNAKDEECLACHRAILERNVLEQSPAGVTAAGALAWYQTLNSYEGPQETFHRRHLATPLAKRVMAMRCNTCHQGQDPREEAPIPPDQSNQAFTLRKAVNPDFCWKCHGANNYKVMGLPSPWPESREAFQNNCLLCHAGIRTNRHQVNYLQAEAIEEAGAEDADVCFGCHGGRQWYRLPYPFPRHAWKGMAKGVPDWAKDRPTESEPRFRKSTKTAEVKVEADAKDNASAEQKAAIKE